MNGSTSRATRRRLEDAEVRSEDVREVLHGTPSILLRLGLFAVVVSAGLGVLMLYAIRWPEIVDGRVVVTSHDPPVPVAARADGRLEALFAREGDRVERGAVVAVVESSARGADVLALRASLERTSGELERAPKRIVEALSSSWELGDLRAAVSAFVQSVEDQEAFLSLEGYALRLDVLRRELVSHDALKSTVGDERAVLSRSLSLLEAQVVRDRELARRGGLPKLLQDDTERRLAEDQARLKELDATVLRTGLARLSSERAAAELIQGRAERARALERAVRETFRKLEGAVADWVYRFALRAPTTGRVAFFEVWGADQRVKQGDEVLYVVPESLDLVGRIALPQVGAGRVRVGQSVRVRLDSHPPVQFGIVNAKVREISSASRRSELLVTLDFPRGLETTYGRSLEFKQGMSGAASIVTDDVRLLTRVLGPLRHVLVNGPSTQGSPPKAQP